MKILISVFTLLLLLSGCSPNETTSMPLEATLLSHESILSTERIILEPYIPDPFTGELINTSLVSIYRIRYKSDQYEVMGYIAAPSDYMYHKYPILIYNRGGNRSFGALIPEYIGWLALRGYIVLGSQYRRAEQFGGDEINDVIKLIDISESFSFAQQGGVYMLGTSRGGMMTYIASRMDDRIRAAAVWAAVSNLFDSFNDRELAMQQVHIELIGGTPEELPEEFKRRSAVFWADEIMAPLLIGHGGDADWRVLTQHSINMAKALERYGKPHRLIIYPEAGHGFGGTDFLEEMDAWFRLHPIHITKLN